MTSSLKARYLAPARGAGHNPITFASDTTVFDVSAGSTVDAREDPYGDFLLANGWIWLSYVGTTSERPAVGGPAVQMRQGAVYYDTSLSKTIVLDKAGVWRDPANGAQV